MLNKRLCTLGKWTVHFHVRVGGDSENIKTIFNFCPSVGQYFSSDYQNRILNLWLQCAYVRNRRTVNSTFYISQKETIHRCDNGWAARPSFGTASTDPTIRECFFWKFSRIRKPMRWCCILFNNYPWLFFFEKLTLNFNLVNLIVKSHLT